MLRGDLSAMGHLIDRLHDLANVPSRAAKRISEGISEAIQHEFDAGEDPYGRPWKRLAQTTLDTGRTPPPLTDTRGMRDSLDVRPLRGAGVGITIAHPAGPHQTGWSGPQGSGPARPILPNRATMPIAWDEVIEAAVTEEFKR